MSCWYRGQDQGILVTSAAFPPAMLVGMHMVYSYYALVFSVVSSIAIGIVVMKLGMYYYEPCYCEVFVQPGWLIHVKRTRLI